MIKKPQAENVESAGFKPIIENSISRWTVKNYTAMLAKESNIAILQSYISKSNTRYAAENSIRGSIATLGVIATTHFIKIDKENNDVHAKIKSLPAATCKMYDMVTDFLGVLFTLLSHIYSIPLMIPPSIFLREQNKHLFLMC
jgi:hypothetical protein